MYGKIHGRRGRGRRAEKRRLTLESLETRLVLDSQVSMALAGDSAGPDTSALVAFETDQQLRQYLVDAAIARYQELFGKSTWSDWWPYLRWDMASDADVSTDGLVFGGTNVQESGVDEGDFVKTDGSYLYHVGEQTLTIVDLRDPSNLQITARVPLDQQLWSREVYLAGDRLTIISQRHAMLFAQTDITTDSLANGLIADWRDPGIYSDPTVHVAVYDIADRSEPRLIEQLDVEGTLLESRAVGSFVYLVTQESLDLPFPNTYCETDAGDDTGTGGDGQGQQPGGPAWLMETGSLVASSMDLVWPGPRWGNPKCVYESQEQYVQRIADLDVNELLPSLRAADGAGNITVDGLLVTSQDVYRIAGDDGTNLVTIVAIDLADDAPGASSQGVLLEYLSELYGTQSSIYVAGTSWDGDVSTQSTAIARFALQGSDVTPQSIGMVPGQPLNQFSLDEHDGYLRIATTQGWGDSASNQLYVLQEENGRLNVVGQLPEILARGERIFAARFFGDRAYLVTFRQVDPLFVIDLSDPTAPTVLGELKIPGFSHYLQTVGEDLLLGFGRDADPQTGIAGQPQLSLFDVSDPLAPEVAAQFLFDTNAWSHSEAFYDHHAFGCFAEEGVLAIPMESYAGIWDAVTANLNEDRSPSLGFWVFQVNTAPGDESIELLGKIDHGSPGRRSFAVGGNLITVSAEEVQAHPLRDPATRLDRIALRHAAVADEFWVEAGSPEISLDVLGNDRWHFEEDFAGISAVSQPSSGGSVSISEDRLSLIYTPAADFVGMETFVYTVDDESAEVQVHVQEYSDLVRIRLQPVDADGNEISVIEAGQEFRLNVLVEDLREEATGVFGAWVDVRFDSAIASLAGSVEPGADYVNGIAGSLDVAGLIDEVGGFASLERVGTGERLLASIPLVATRSGVLDFEPDGADDSPAHDIGLFDLNRPVGQAEVQYVGAKLTVTGGLHNSDQATDTDGDGSTSPLDALRIVNFLNQYGPLAVSAFRSLAIQAVSDTGAQSAETMPPMWYDVNGDGHVTPLDVLRVVNRLNERSPSGEAEFAALAAEWQAVLPESDCAMGDEPPGEMDCWVDRLRPVVDAESRAVREAAQPPTRPHRMRDGADELESILEDILSSDHSPQRFPGLES